MPLLLTKDLPRYECLLKAAEAHPELDPSACEVYLNMLRASDEVFGVLERYLATHHVSMGRFGILMLLWKDLQMEGKTGGTPACDAAVKGRTPTELARLAGVTRATMTGLIDTLENDNYVRREPDPADRRVQKVRLTPEGVAFLRGLLPGHFQLISHFMETLTTEERGTLVRLLSKILQQALLHGTTSPTS